MKRLLPISIIALALTGCANPLNRITMERYARTCADAARTGQLEIAEEACRRAYINTRIGNLGPELESQELYNLARIEKQLLKFVEAEEYYKESLRLQESLPAPDPIKIGRRLTDLSIVYWDQKKYKDAWPFLSRIIPIADSYTGKERSTVKLVFNKYAEEYDRLQMSAEAELLRNKADAL